MGGAAFASQLGKEAFPRLPPRVYAALKSRLFPKLSGLYSLTAVPIEAPEKTSFGDLDILVADPRVQPGDVPSSEQYLQVPHETIQALLGAKYMIQSDGYKTSNYAIPVALGEWSALGHKEDEMNARSLAGEGEIFYQVDVHPCRDKSDFERVKFFNSYGDMGMILGLMARQIGLQLGLHGLKIPSAPHPPFELSADFNEIMPFLGLTMAVYESGFGTKKAVFEWASSMRWFNSLYFKSTGPGMKKVKADRIMYAEFVQWVSEQRSLKSEIMPDQPRDQDAREALYQAVKKEALQYFNKTAEFETQLSMRNTQDRYRAIFSGHQVRDWADMGEYWKGVKMIMDEVRTRLGGPDKVAEFHQERGEDALKALVLEARDALGLSPTNLRFPETH